MGLEFLDNCRFGVLQLVVVRSATTAAAAACHWRGVFGEGSLDPRRGFLWVTVSPNLSTPSPPITLP